jgi:OmpA-OmpF porin, OOP family
MGRKILINKNQLKESLFIVLLLYTFIGNAQNLVTNPGFEDIDSCYGSTSALGFDVFEWAGCKGWSNPIKSSSDLFCNPPADLGFTYQWPRSGNSMAAILINAGSIQNYREYVQNELLEPLEKGLVYNINVYVSGSLTSCVANSFGIRFFEEEYIDTSTMWLTNLSCDAVNNSSEYMVDTVGWQKIEMNYVAKGGEKHFIFGNFQDSLTLTYTSPCDTSFWNGVKQGGDYVFLDDFIIERAKPNAQIPNVFTPNGDGINDVFSFSVSNCTDWELNILNRWGNTLAVCTPDQAVWSGEEAPDGTYFYVLKSDTCDLNKHGFVQLIR